MTIDENTGHDVVCPICDTPEYWECEHLVASLDRSFLDCYGGALFDRFGDVSSMIEDALIQRMSEPSAPVFEDEDLNQISQYARKNFKPGDDYVEIDGSALQRLVITLLEDAGAYDLPGALIDPGGPGMTSAMSLLFAEEPEKVVSRALDKLSLQLAIDKHEARSAGDRE